MSHNKYTVQAMLDALNDQSISALLVPSNALQDMIEQAVDYTQSDVADVLATGHAGIMEGTDIYIDAMLPERYVSSDAFYVVRDPLTIEENTTVVDLIGLLDLVPLSSIEMEAGPSYCTPDEFHSWLNACSVVKVFLNIEDDRSIYIPISRIEARNLYVGRHGFRITRAYVNKSMELILGEPVPETVA